MEIIFFLEMKGALLCFAGNDICCTCFSSSVLSLNKVAPRYFFSHTIEFNICLRQKNKDRFLKPVRHLQSFTPSPVAHNPSPSRMWVPLEALKERVFWTFSTLQPSLAAHRPPFGWRRTGCTRLPPSWPASLRPLRSSPCRGEWPINMMCLFEKGPGLPVH